MNAQPLEIDDFVDDVLTEDSADGALFDYYDPIGWIERHFWIPETNAPIVLMPYQRAVITEALRKDEHGQFLYSLVLYSDLKKSAKSTIAAAVTFYLAWHTPWETVRIVANDLKQADSRTFFYIERAITLNKDLRERCKSRKYHIDLPNHTTIDAIPVDPKGEAGGGDLIVCFTELWAAKNDAAKQLWSETTLSPLKFGKSLRWCESYAGFTGESPILEQLYDTGVKQGRLVDVGIDGLELYINDAARMLALWNTKPRCPWQTTEYYQQEQAVLIPSEFGRIHENKWADAVETFVPFEWWTACKKPIPALKPNQSIVLAMDAAVSNDCFALIGVSRDEGVVQVRYIRVWYPPKGGEIDFSEPEKEVRRLCTEWPVIEVCYDPSQLADMAQRLTREGINMRKFEQGAPRAVADKALHDRIRDRRIAHSGEPDLEEHIKNAHKTPEDKDKLRIVKGSDLKKKIDAAVALSMGADRVSFLNAE